MHGPEMLRLWGSEPRLTFLDPADNADLVYALFADQINRLHAEPLENLVKEAADG